MLSKTVIRKMTYNTTYLRGIDIHNVDNVSKFDVEEDGDYDYIKARVKGSGHNSYEVNAVYDAEADLVDDIDCECLAFSSYNGICKHCVAVLLEYIDYRERKDSILLTAKKKEAALEKLQNLKGAIGKKGQTTTPVMKQLLTQSLIKRTLPIAQDSVYGKVRIEPQLTCESNGAQVEFKVGVKQMYVLKDIFAFEKAFLYCEDYYYGKKLKFVHTVEAFAIDCRPIVKFLLNWTQKNRSQYMNPVYHGYTYSYMPARLRSISLTGDELEEFLDAAGTWSIIANVNRSGERVWNVTEEEISREMSIRKKNDGIEVKINQLFGYQSNHEYIYFKNKKIYRVKKDKMEPISEFLQCMDEVPERSVYIQKEDVPVFCRELLPVLERYFQCSKVDFDEADYGVVPAEFEIYLDAPQKSFITCKAIAVYGDRNYNIFNQMSDIQIRDQAAEVEARNLVSSFCNAYDDKEQLMVVANDEEKIYKFITDGIPKMQEFAKVYVSDALKRLKVTSAPKVVIGVSVSGNLMELSITSDDISREQLLEILSKYNKKKRFYRLKSGDFVNLAGDEMDTLYELRQGLNLSEAQLSQKTIEIPKFRALYLDAELRERTSIQVLKDNTFEALVQNMKIIEDKPFEIPETLQNVLREYQKRGFLWIKKLKQNGFGGILADDMGLGKTLQVICFLLSEYLEGKNSDTKNSKNSLIVCPASLVYNWNYEIEKFAPELQVKMVIGTPTERKDILHNVGKADILITSYDLLKRDITQYEKLEFQSQIVDEAQFIKNYNTQVAKAVKNIHADFKLALTGTPIENRLSELWSIFDYLMPGFLYSYKRFHEELEISIVQNQEETAVKRLQKMITPFVLRRLKSEVLSDLPEKLEESIYAKMEGEQQKLYDAHVKKLQIMLDKQSEKEFKNSKIRILSELMKLRQICCNPSLLYEDYRGGSSKMELCVDLIKDAVSGGHKILLFSQFTTMLDHLQKQLQKENISFYSLTGATSKENRARLVEKFNKDDTSVFCISLKAGGTGLNLTAADIVIHYDPWWNLAVQNQATDRAHRIGQKNVVSVYKLIVKGTIEENIQKMQNMKKELAEQVLGGEGMKEGSFSREELLELLQ